MQARRFPARVLEIRGLGSNVWLTVHVEGWPGAAPGQFALVQAEPSSCFLARPLSVSQEADGESVSFLIAPIGQGTKELCSLMPGGNLSVTGPLGNGFPLSTMAGAHADRLVLVGGGAGVAPFPLLLKRLAVEEGLTRGLSEVVVLLGFREAAQAEGAAPVVEAAAVLDGSGTRCRCVLASEDGSVGIRGLVSRLVSAELRGNEAVAVCGPWAMAESVWNLCSAVRGVRAWFNLETFMACGVGSCHGCVIRLADGSLARVCAEGPVFTGRSIWESPTPPEEAHGGER